jgi:anti-sigma factor RsiW
VNVGESHLAQEAIVAYVDDELSAGATGRAARHLERCAQCRTAVQAQREAKAALLDSSDVAVPGDLLSRLRAIPFTADVPGGGSLSGLAAGPDQLTTSGAGGHWAVSLRPRHPQPRPGEARWLRYGVVGALAGVGLGLAAVVAASVSAGGPARPAPASVAGPSAPAPEQRTAVVPPVVRAITVGTTATVTGGTP